MPDPKNDSEYDAADEAELEVMALAGEDLDGPRTFAHDDENLVAADDARQADLESERLADDDLEAMGSDGDESDIDERLDEGLEETFPASDPVSINPPSH